MNIKEHDQNPNNLNNQEHDGENNVLIKDRNDFLAYLSGLSEEKKAALLNHYGENIPLSFAEVEAQLDRSARGKIDFPDEVRDILQDFYFDNK